MIELSSRQLEILTFMQMYSKKTNGLIPLAQIVKSMHFNVKSVRTQLKALQQLGKISVVQEYPNKGKMYKVHDWSN